MSDEANQELQRLQHALGLMRERKVRLDEILELRVDVTFRKYLDELRAAHTGHINLLRATKDDHRYAQGMLDGLDLALDAMRRMSDEAQALEPQITSAQMQLDAWAGIRTISRDSGGSAITP